MLRLLDNLFKIGKNKLILLGLAILLFLVIICMFAHALASALAVQAHEEQVEKYINPDDYSGYMGLPLGVELSQDPLFITKNFIVFRDRALEKFEKDDEQLKKNTNSIIEDFQALPEGINKYFMAVPTSIAFEPEFEQYSGDQQGQLKKLKTEIGSVADCLDVYPLFVEKFDEYIYFRTDSYWTSRGAYHAAGLFCDEKEIDRIPIEEYNEHFLSFNGAYSINGETKGQVELLDKIFYYTENSLSNTQLLTKIDDDTDELLSYEAPAVSVSRRGIGIFLGTDISHSILEGDGTNGESVLVLSEHLGRLFAPWLTPYYKNVIYVNESRNTLSKQMFFDLIEKYNVTNVIALFDLRYLNKINVSFWIED